MEARLDLCGQRLAALLGADDFDGAIALLRSKFPRRAHEIQDYILLALRESPPPTTALGAVAEALWELMPDADGFSVLAERLEVSGAMLAAQAAQRGAATLDFEAHPAMDVFGGPFNGQLRRQAIFDQLVKRLEIVAIIETGTFRGTSTAYMAKAGVPVFSCELHPRYFHYSSLRLAGIGNIQLELADSRRFLRQIFDKKQLPAGPAFFYLDAHWEQDLPLWDEIELIFSRHPAPVIMVDDFRVPADSGFSYDDYGAGKGLSVSDLRRAVSARPSMFFPNHASAHETGARRGCVVLAQGDIAHSIMCDVPMVAKLSWIDALVLDGFAELRDECRLLGDLKRALADSEAQLTVLANSLREAEDDRTTLTNSLKDAEAGRATLTNSLKDAEADRATLTNSLKDAEADRAALTNALREVEVERDSIIAHRTAILASRSWRITAPLRKARINLSGTRS
jgi:predicted O-methyltransferase YrrM